MADWRPDWRDLSNYPFGKRRSDHWWAWQFVRRNKGYEDAWEEEIERFSRKIGKNRAPGATSIPALLTEWHWNETWGFLPCQDPAVESPPHMFTGRISVVPGGLVQSLEEFREMLLWNSNPQEQENRWVAILDLGRELKPQLRQIEVTAKRQQQRQVSDATIEVRPKKRQSRKWAFYLCLLDADASSAGPREIAETFDHDPPRPSEVLTDKLIRTRLKKALELTEPESYLWEFFGLR